jgi:hypothetical protein
MLSESFRLVAARLIPRPGRRKQALVLATAILAGCGGSGQPKAKAVTVTGPALTFAVPAGWTVTSANGRTTAKHGSDVLEVSSFPLVHPYSDALFTKVEPELAARMGEVAKQAGGTLGGHRTVIVDRIRAHSYDLKVGGRVDVYTFVLRGKREYLLVCSASSDVCTQLLASFFLS